MWRCQFLLSSIHVSYRPSAAYPDPCSPASLGHTIRPILGIHCTRARRSSPARAQLRSARGRLMLYVLHMQVDPALVTPLPPDKAHQSRMVTPDTPYHEGCGLAGCAQDALCTGGLRTPSRRRRRRRGAWTTIPHQDHARDEWGLFPPAFCLLPADNIPTGGPFSAPNRAMVWS